MKKIPFNSADQLVQNVQFEQRADLPTPTFLSFAFLDVADIL